MADIRTISIDIETFSDVDLGKCGVYKYAQSDRFEILLFAYAVNGGLVQVVDLAEGESISDEILAALADESVVKWAFNASFERVCLSNYLRKYYPVYFESYSVQGDTVGDYLNPSSWRCSMIWSAYMGLPLSLEGAGAVLGLEEQKLKEGKELIRYFCVPCKATKTNGGRTRNLPEHDMDKWKLFKFYNQRDVEVEMSIQERLQKYPVPDFVWDEYHLDQEINDRGILLDMDVVENAIKFDEASKAEIAAAMRDITNLDNPNSVSQMKDWLSEQGVEAESLGKKDVAKLIGDVDGEVKDALMLRQQLAKSSVKKYQAMQNAVCRDGRARGMFMFYGANRRLAQAKSKNDKNISGLLNQIIDNKEAGKIGIHTFTNASSFNVGESDVKIISIEFAASEEVMAQFFGSVIVGVKADQFERSVTAKTDVVIPSVEVEGLPEPEEEIVDDEELPVIGNTKEQTVSVELPVTWKEDGQALVHFTFEFNDSIIEIHQPEEYWHSGRHSIMLYYPIEGLIANYRNIFNVYMRVEGGSATVDVGDCLAGIMGQSMGAGEAWDGEIKIEEYIKRVNIGGAIKMAKATENIGWIIDETLKRKYTDTVHGRVAIGAFAMPVER